MSSEFQEESLTLRDDHTWTAAPGCRIFVLGRGALRFDFPQDWVVIPDDDSTKLYDKRPPDDDCVLAASIMQLPPINWEAVSVTKMLEIANQGESRPIDHFGPIQSRRRNDLEFAWREMRFIDPVGKRDARSRFCIARKGKIQTLITFEFWADDAERCVKVWNTVLETLRVGEFIDDPTQGPKRSRKIGRDPSAN